MKNDRNPIQKSADVKSLDSEFRYDPATGLWALVCEGRAERPSNTETRAGAPSAVSPEEPDPECCFCPGSESQTPELVAMAAVKRELGEAEPRSTDDVEFFVRPDPRQVEGLRWLARAVENKYPVFRTSEDGAPFATFREVQARFERGENEEKTRFFQSVRGEGRHEVVVDSARHIRSWSEFTPLEMKLAFRMFRLRLRAFRDSGKFPYSFVFKNVGPNAGASQRHSHCQLTGNAQTPERVRNELARLIQYERTRKARGERKSYYDALLDAELDAQARVVAATERFVVYCPYASRFPMQTEICPRFDEPFEDYSDAALDELALLMRQTAAALEEAKRRYDPSDFSPLDYNVVMKNAPTALDPDLAEGERLMRPRWLVLPSLVKKAGYEIGCDIDINPVAPETAAKMLRAVFGGADRF